MQTLYVEKRNKWLIVDLPFALKIISHSKIGGLFVPYYNVQSSNKSIILLFKNFRIDH